MRKNLKVAGKAKGLTQQDVADKPGTSYGFRPDRYNQIIVFNSESDFNAILAANPHMTAIMGADDHTKSEYPGVFIAGIREEASSHEDRKAGHSQSTQTQF